MNHKLFSLILAICIFCSACSPTAPPSATPLPANSPDPNTVGTPEGPSGKITLMISGDPTERDAYTQLIAAFKPHAPRLEVELQQVPGEDDYVKRLGADLAAGTPPDLVLLSYRRYSAFAANGLFDPLGPYLSQSFKLLTADFYPEALRPFYWRGVLTCIPQNADGLVVYYNKTLFDAAGQPYPHADWKWPDFLAAARALTRDLDGDGHTDQYGVAIEPTLVQAAPFVWQNGGDLVFNPDAPTRLSLDKPEALEALQWFTDLQTVHHVAPGREEAMSEGAAARFRNGRAAMLFDSRHIVPDLRANATFDWDIAPMPQNGQHATTLNAEGYCMPAAARNRPGAWAFVEFALGHEGQTLMAQTGRIVPSRIEIAQSELFLAPTAKPAHSQVFVDAVAQTRFPPVIGTWVDVEKVVNSELERAFYGDASVPDVIASANTRVVDFLKLAIDLRPTPVPGATAGATTLPDCAKNVNTVDLVPGFPLDYPFPPGTAYLQSYAYPETEGFYALAVVPLILSDAIKFYQDTLVGTGYSLSPGDAEPGEIDLVLKAPGRQGNLRAGVPLGCETVTIIEVSIAKQP